MAQHGFTLRFADDEFVARTRVLPFVHSPTGVPLDVVLAGPGLEDEFLARAIEVDFDGTAVPVISPEDLIITTVLAGRSKDVEDIRGVLRERSGSLDVARIRAILRVLEEGLGQSDLLIVFDEEMRKLE
jgi:hypothetical protein